MTPCVSIITITMNHLGYITEMMNSLFTTARPTVSFEMIIVDNCSTDGTVDFLRSHYPNVKIVQNKEIYGFAQNNNIGAREATGEYIFILNPDVIVKPKAIDRLYYYAKEHPDCGVLAPRLLNMDGSAQYSARNFLSIQILFNRFLTMGNDQSNNKKVVSYLMKDLPLDKPSDVDWCMGAALMISREFYDELEGFDDNYFLYIEDMDICYRTWHKGKKVTFLPTAVFLHAHKRESRYVNKKTWIHLKSFLYFLKKNRFRRICRPDL